MALAFCKIFDSRTHSKNCENSGRPGDRLVGGSNLARFRRVCASVGGRVGMLVAGFEVDIEWMMEGQ